MDIVEVARASGLSAATLRYYEQRGLIRSIGRSGLRRVFGPDILERLALIALGQQAGFALDEIAAVLAPEPAAIDRALLLRKAAELEAQISALTVMRDGLRHAAACSAPSYFECPTFLRLLRYAVRHKAKRWRALPVRRLRRNSDHS